MSANKEEVMEWYEGCGFPSPLQIQQMCEEIRMAWDDDEYYQRSQKIPCSYRPLTIGKKK